MSGELVPINEQVANYLDSMISAMLKAMATYRHVTPQGELRTAVLSLLAEVSSITHAPDQKPLIIELRERLQTDLAGLPIYDDVTVQTGPVDADGLIRKHKKEVGDTLAALEKRL